MKQIFLWRCYLVLILVIIGIGPAQVFGQEDSPAVGYGLAITPFVVKSQQDSDFLRQGVETMLANRLAARTKALIVPLAQADYRLAGTITVMGNRISISVTLRHLHNGLAPFTAVAVADNEDGVITAVDELVASLVAGGLGVKAGGGRSSRAGQPLVNTQGISTFRKTQNVKLALRTMAVGDVDGDGKMDVILAGENSAHIYHLHGQQLRQFAQLSLGRQYKIIAVSLVDLNEDGHLEVYLSGVKGNRPRSLAAQWQEGHWHNIFVNQPWYVRPVKYPHRGLLLIGQGAGRDGAFRGEIYELRVVGHELQRGASVSLPTAVNLYNFSWADIDGDGHLEVLAIDAAEHLRVFRADDSILWQSSEGFAGSINYVGGQAGLDHRRGRGGYQQLDPIDGRPAKRLYIPAPLIITDINKDGKDDVLLSKNGNAASHILDNMRYYSSGKLVALGWDGLGLAEIWQSTEIMGSPFSYALRQGTLYVGVALNRSLDAMFTSQEATLLLSTLPE